MQTRHFKFWPTRVPYTLSVPETTLHDNLAVTARRYPNKQAVYYYGATLTYAEVLQRVNALAGYLKNACGVQKGDRVFLYMQNSPQYLIAFTAILRAGAAVVPINPMNRTEELAFYLEDSQASVAIIGQELYGQLEPLHRPGGVEHVIAATYSDYLPQDVDYDLPDVVRAPRVQNYPKPVIPWTDVLSANMDAGADTATIDDIAVLPYTSGTTGRPKGCIHTHRTVQANVVGAAVWHGVTPDGVSLTTLPLFHVTGMVHSMLTPMYCGGQMVIMTRWDRNVAAQLVERTRVTHWTNISTMVVDFLANPKLADYNLSSFMVIGGGGAALPQAVGEKLFQLTGVRYAEGYGLSETISQTHVNPPDHPKLQCMGIPAFDVDARVIDPVTLEELGPGEEGEVVIHGPQVFLGYWNRDDENEKAFLTLDGKRFFRTGDIAKTDEDGYFFMVDRVKRMINASGFKVWPTEVETLLYGHPDIEQACVIGTPDERRGETVKAFVILRPGSRGMVTEQEIMDWAKERMAAYKYPRIIEFVEALPVSGTGKILWRVLQEEEKKKAKQA